MECLKYLVLYDFKWPLKLARYVKKYISITVMTLNTKSKFYQFQMHHDFLLKVNSLSDMTYDYDT